MAVTDPKLPLAIGLVSALAVGVPALAQGDDADEPTARERGGRECFYQRQITGYRTAKDEGGKRSDTSILVDVRAGETFLVTFAQRCPDVRWAQTVRFTRTGVGRICDGLDIDVIVPDVTGPQRCTIQSIRRLTAGEPGARAGARE
ncbi:hypothetical protein NAP1_10168 [Erythrobacter sp. NAP1]|uniref:DUF6491 family protein n=1 Tax=Erythrobacter sp. NAP1 TaxID=237727 RepID=UPI0000687765|nr:DUF6491 family protein [Erythrobacter sp. NAP1]EAQ27951.1 hypothetical protein NAP1_10168 [Erythrobacter sp. NAP1]